MKSEKSLIIIALAVLAVSVAVAAVSASLFFESRNRLTDEQIVKQLLDGLSTNITQYDKKGFVISFREKYNVEASSEKDINDIAFSMTYDGEGTVSMSYELDSSEAPAFDMSNLMNYGTGYLSGTQSERYTYYNKSVRVVDGEDTEYIQDSDYSIAHDFIIKIDGDDYYAASESAFTDGKDSANNKTDSFCGKINKNVLIDAVSSEKMSKAMSRLFFMETWTYIRQINELSTGYFKMTKFESYEEVADFIRENGIDIVDYGKTVKVDFALNTTKILSEYSDAGLGEMPKIYGSMEIERETGDIIHFEYNLGAFLLSVLMKTNVNKPYFKAQVEEFILEGEILSSGLPDKTPDKAFKEYDENTRSEFVYQFSKHLIPFGDQEG